MNIIREIQKRWFPKTLKCVYKKDILEYALKHHRYLRIKENYGGLCITIRYALEHYGICVPCMIKTMFPLFTNDNASSLFNATYCENLYSCYWWSEGIWDTGRLDFLKWLLEQYKDDKTNLKEL